MFMKLRALQRQAVAASGNLVLHAPPGAGKTLAYLMPFFSQKPEITGKPSLVVCVPTRELADQVLLDIHKLRSPQLRVISATAATPAPLTAAELRRGCEVVVGTPGRLHSFLKTGDLEIANVNTLVLDEADLLLSSEKSAELVRAVSGRKIFASATFDPWLKDLVSELMGGSFSLIGSEQNKPCMQFKGVRHFIAKCKGTGRELQAAIDFASPTILRARPKNLVYCPSKFEICSLECSRALKAAFFLHTDLSPEARRQVLFRFNQFENSATLVTTDSAARGLNLSQVGLVIHWTGLPKSRDDYVHRIGRMRPKEGDECMSILALASKKDLGEASRRVGFKLENLQQAIPSESQLKLQTAETLISQLASEPEPASAYLSQAADLLSVSSDPTGLVAGAIALLEKRYLKSLEKVSPLSGLPDFSPVLLFDPLGVKVKNPGDAKRLVRGCVGPEKHLIGKICLTKKGYVVDIANSAVRRILEDKRLKASRIRALLLTTLPPLVEDSSRYRVGLAAKDKKLARKSVRVR